MRQTRFYLAIHSTIISDEVLAGNSLHSSWFDLLVKADGILRIETKAAREEKESTLAETSTSSTSPSSPDSSPLRGPIGEISPHSADEHHGFSQVRSCSPFAVGSVFSCKHFRFGADAHEFALQIANTEEAKDTSRVAAAG